MSITENTFFLEKKARGKSLKSMFNKPWSWRTFKLVGQNLEYYHSNQLKGTFDTSGSVCAICNTAEVKGKTYPFYIRKDSETLFLNASTEYIRQKCINIINRSSYDKHWNNPEANTQAEKEVISKVEQMVIINLIVYDSYEFQQLLINK